MARWQLQCSGKAEEDRCKFCQSQLPDWRDALFKDVICDETPSRRLSSPSPRALVDDEAQDSDGSGSDGSAGSADADGSAMPARSSTPSPDASGRAPAGAPEGGVSRSSDRPPLNGPPARRASVDAGSPGPTRSSAGDPGGSPALGDVKGDIIVKFNDMSFRCKVRTGQEGLEDFMAQIREKCGIPEEKMRCLNLTYRCKDPNTGSQMTLQGVNESAFDAAVLCSAAQDKIKQRRRASRDGGRIAKGESRVPSFLANEETNAHRSRVVATRDATARDALRAPVTTRSRSTSFSSASDDSTRLNSDGAGETSTASGKSKREDERVEGSKRATDPDDVRGDDPADGREDGGSRVPCPGSPGKSGRREYRGCDAASTRTRRRRNSLDESGPLVAADAEDARSNGRNEGSRPRDASGTPAPSPAPAGGFRRGARRLSAPPPSSSGLGGASLPVPGSGPAGDAEPTGRRRARRPWPSFMSAWTRSEA
jgi:hypothetical protein